MSGPFNQGESYGVAVNAKTGQVYVSSYYNGNVNVFGPLITVPSISEIVATDLTPTSTAVSATVSPDTEHGGGEITGSSGICAERRSMKPSFETGVRWFGEMPPSRPYSASQKQRQPDWTQPSTTYHYRIAATNSQGTNYGEYGEENTFTSLPAVAELKTEAATDIIPTGATLNGSFVGNGENTEYYFEWGIEQGTYKQRTPLPPADAGSPAGPAVTKVSLDLTELIPNTTYYYRVVAINHVGTTIASNEESFATPAAVPAINGESATDVHSEGAVIQARINPGGAETGYQFEYGTNMSYGASAPVPSASAGSGRVFEGVQIQVSGLTPGTTYHYRIFATNSSGTTMGPDQTFTTFPFLSKLNEGCPNSLARQQTGAALLLDCRAYELVSAATPAAITFPIHPTGEEAPLRRLSRSREPRRGSSTRSTTAPSPAPTTPPTKAPIPMSPPEAKTAGRPNTSAYRPTTPLLSEPFSSVPSGADAGLETFAFGAPGGCSPCFEGGYTGIPVRLPTANSSRAWRARSTPVPRPSPQATSPRTSPPTANTSSSAPNPSLSPTANEGEISIYDRNLNSRRNPRRLQDAEPGRP